MIENRTYNIVTFGCQMNERDSETLSGMLEGLGYEFIQEKTLADVVILNTCSVRENADKRFFGVLGQLNHHKRQRPEMIVAVCGCMMQQQHIVDTLKAKYPWVDLVFGTHNIHMFPQLLENIEKQQKHIVDIWQDGGAIVEGLPAKRAYGFKSYVNIMYGCNNYCTYCIVPYTRGRERSRQPEEILEEITKLAQEGTKEVTLLGQNVNSYGKAAHKDGSYCLSDCGDGPDFAGLLDQIDRIPGLERIRFMTSHPKDLSDELITAFSRCRHLCKHIHLPVQAGSNSVLERMNRMYTREHYIELVGKLRAACPSIAVSTDIIVGFPGETEKDFLDTLSLAEQIRFDSAFTFLYSVRKGTPASSFGDQIPESIKHERFNRLVDVVHSIQKEKNTAWLGKVVPVLVEGSSRTKASVYTGHTDSYKIVDFPGTEEMTGKIVPVKITKAQTFSLYGEMSE